MSDTQPNCYLPVLNQPDLKISRQRAKRLLSRGVAVYADRTHQALYYLPPDYVEIPWRVEAQRRSGHQWWPECRGGQIVWACEEIDTWCPTALSTPGAIRLARLQAARAHLVKNAVGSHTTDEWEAILGRFGHQCLRCEIAAEHAALTKDHVVSLASGGTDYASNLQPLCLACNVWKGKREIDFRTRFWNDYRAITPAHRPDAPRPSQSEAPRPERPQDLPA